jgi:hypothetical protein
LLRFFDLTLTAKGPVALWLVGPVSAILVALALSIVVFTLRRR